MRQIFKNSRLYHLIHGKSTLPVVYEGEVQPEAETAKAPRRRPGARLRRASEWLNILMFGSLLVMLLANWVNSARAYGLAGWVDTTVEGMQTDCGTSFSAFEAVVFMPDVPCGTRVQVYHLGTGRAAVATVVHREVAFRSGSGRVVDLSMALAKALGVATDAPGLAPVALTRLDGPVAGLQAAMVHQPQRLQLPEERQLLGRYTPEDVYALTQNILGEIGGENEKGAYAVVQVTSNRQKLEYRGAKSLAQVVFDCQGGDPGGRNGCQFSWTGDGKPDPNEGWKGWAKAGQIARQELADRVPGRLMGQRYALRYATHYYAPDVFLARGWQRPYWVSSMVRVRALNDAVFRHRFYQPRSAPVLLAAR
jgi:rare lipoprotein A (peptidoglycan hydrolase)